MDQLLQIAVQVPIVGCICLVAWKIGVLAINRWYEGDKERTRIMAESFASLTSMVQNHASEDAESHATLRARIDTALDLAPIESARRKTPIRGVPRRSTDGADE